MTHRPLPRSTAGLAVLAVTAALAFAGASGAAEVTRPLRGALTPAAGAVLELENLAGTLRIERSPGAELVIEGTVHAESAALADRLKLELSPAGGKVSARLTYPLDEHRRYVYPVGSDTGFFSGLSQSNGKFQGREVSVYSGSRSGAVLLYCDLTIRLPQATGATIRTLAGPISAEKVQGDLTLDTGSGDVRSLAGAGRLSIDTGSGDVTVERHEGMLSIDTGSGDVRIAAVHGDVTVDTGSGAIDARELDGGKASFDTGSGDLRLHRVAASILVDTGSGNVSGTELASGSELGANTGSGDVRLAGDFSKLRNLRADTGSGDVVLEPSGELPALRLEVSTSSGGVEVDLPGLSVERSKHGDFFGRVGDGSAGLARVETGSGDVTIRRLAR